MTPSPVLPSPSLGARRLLTLIAVASIAVLVAACGDAEYEITDVRHTAAATAPAPGSAGWGYALPPGWTALPPAPMRELGFQIAGHEDALCTFSILQGTGGGLSANVNRWRKQMGLAPASDDEIAKLPHRRFLGETAVEVDLEGEYVGMGNAKIANARMFGLIVVVEQASAFLKMVGPGAVIDAERGNFQRLLASIRPPGAPSDDMPAGHPPTGATPPMGDLPPGHPPMGAPAPSAEPPSRLKWAPPEGWVKQPPRRMREVTFRPGGAKDAECYITILGGMGGGVEANINRWRQQMGKPALEAEAFAALKRADVLGTQGVFVTISDGDFTGDSGEDLKGAALLGCVVIREGRDLITIKMRGPASEVLPEQANFEAFCTSLSE